MFKVKSKWDKSKKILVASMTVTSACAIGLLAGVIVLSQKSDAKGNQYVTFLADESYALLDKGLRSESTIFIQSECENIDGNDHDFNENSVRYSIDIVKEDGKVVNAPSGEYCHIERYNNKKDIFQIHIEQTSISHEVICRLTANITNGQIVYDEFSFAILPPLSSNYTATTSLIEDKSRRGEGTDTYVFSDVMLSEIGNVDYYTVACSNLQKDGVSMTDWTCSFSATAPKCVRFVPTANNKVSGIQVMSKGSSILTVNYYASDDIQKNDPLITIQRNFTLADSDIVSSAWSWFLTSSDDIYNNDHGPFYPENYNKNVTNNTTIPIDFSNTFFNGLPFTLADFNQLGWAIGYECNASESGEVDVAQFNTTQTVTIHNWSSNPMLEFKSSIFLTPNQGSTFKFYFRNNSKLDFDWSTYNN